MYRYETHMHTHESSACGVTPGMDYAAYYKSLGFSGIIITDHFFGGNTRAPRTGAWEYRINAFCLGYEKAKEAGDAIGFPVFFGWEENFEGDEFLIYGLDKQWLLAHPDISDWSRNRYYKEVHASGGLVVQAHPFRERDYLNAVRLNPENCDAWEGYNASNSDAMNFRAVQYAKDHGIFITAGSDLHRIGALPDDEIAGMTFETPLTDIKDYVARIQQHEGVPYVTPRRLYPENGSIDMTTDLPLIINPREC